MIPLSGDIPSAKGAYVKKLIPIQLSVERQL